MSIQRFLKQIPSRLAKRLAGDRHEVVEVGFSLEVVFQKKLVGAKSEDLLAPADFFECTQQGGESQNDQKRSRETRQVGLLAMA